MASDRLVELYNVACKRLDDDAKSAKPKYEIKNITALYQLAYISILEEKDIEKGLEISSKAKKYIDDALKATPYKNIWGFEHYLMEEKKSHAILELFYDICKLESFYKLDSFIFCMERKRAQEKRFYLPRKKTLEVVVHDLEDLENRKIKFYGLSLPSRVGKSTTCIFFLAWIMMKRPNSHNAMGGHSGLLAKGFYKELLNLIDTEEYSFKDLYAFWHPNHEIIKDKSAEEFTITLDEPDRFATVTCRGIDGTWTGAVDVSKDGYLYVDDLVRDREHSLSPQRMENTFQEYLNKMVDRKNDGARELMVGTLWNVLDPLERIRIKNEDDPLYRFRQIPALNENDESNFDYDFNAGFSTAYYREMRQRLDNAEWMAKFQQQPYVREGLLMPPDELRFFNGILPDGDHRIVSVVDVAYGGGDSLSMPIGAEYENGDVYIIDWVFNKGAKEETIPIVAGKIIQNEIRKIQFEGNQGGDLYCDYINEELKREGYKCSCTSKKAPNKMAKMEKIVAYSGDIKRKFVFLSPKAVTAEELAKDAELGITRYVRSKEYQNAMNEVHTFVTIGKNEHDDAIDGLTQLAMAVEGINNNATVQAVMNPFRMRGGY